ncbi:hypothetical protein BGW36DRAFT_286951 [Talaromyces proteolyticus]|uniref:Zn(2)-C6 fungal-type domain-containing protein n=1 Tax=Talaromyces proteolyticus TaxID=1131652 RepID=A0AAD4L108_9EURO|nr:uncharacterized protein BGW36DRAFT_286951 [Talaromyces proteolyticus]KAH8704243.1 hypothetical protein BGW36DRAFT_286951 [Talaromyces proteolyticus]
MPNSRSCDQCYAHKKKCRFQDGSTSCGRCTRYSISCSMVRDQVRPGRPARPKALGPGGYVQVWRSGDGLHNKKKKTRVQQKLDPVPSSPSFTDALAMREAVIAKSTTTELGEHKSPRPPKIADFYAINDIFMIGPTFAPKFYHALEYTYGMAPDLLRDMFSAMETYLDCARRDPAAARQMDITEVTNSLRKLRATEITNENDGLAVMLLGQTLAAFDSFFASAGSMLILRHSLYLVKPWYSQLAQADFLDSVTITPLFWDIVWCLINREVPIIRPHIIRPQVADRIAGLCTSLIPVLYDLCTVSNQMASKPYQAGTNDLEDIERRVRAWQPDEDSLKSVEFTEIEILSMRAQASMYRSAALLLIHRLVHPISSQDGIAVSYANDIFEQRDDFFALCKPDTKLQYTSFPIFLALLEIPLRSRSIWKTMTRFPIRPANNDQIISLLKYVWEQRWNGFKGSLFELLGKGGQFISVI